MTREQSMTNTAWMVSKRVAVVVVAAETWETSLVKCLVAWVVAEAEDNKDRRRLKAC